MRLVELPPAIAILLCGLVWLILQSLTAAISRWLPDRFFKAGQGLYKTRSWERKGQVYHALFRIRRWKHWLPDGGAIVPGGYAKKHLTDYSKDNLLKFLNESCRAEFSHWLAVAPFWVFGLFAPPGVIPVMLAYALAVNLPCILAQRFNRPRIERVLAGLDRHQSSQVNSI